MITIRTKDELILAIKRGEQHVKIESLDLYAACKLAEIHSSISALLKHYAIKSIMSVFGPVGTMNIVADGVVVSIAISISVLIAAIAIIGILKDKKVKIKCKGYGVDGEIEII